VRGREKEREREREKGRERERGGGGKNNMIYYNLNRQMLSFVLYLQ